MMVDPMLINSTIVESIAKASNDVVGFTQVLVGGFVGLYIISIILTYYTNRQIMRLLKQIRDELRKGK